MINTDLQLDFFRQMMTIRIVEELLLKLFSQGLLRGTVHTCIGQEACAVGVVNAMKKDLDIVCTNHRGHGHYLAYCEDIEGLIAEVMGKSSGICKGIGGSQHLQRDNFYSNGILGGMAPVTVGMAFAEKQLKRNTIATLFLGDGALAEGSVYESMNFASLWDLPILYAVELNRYAQSTSTSLEHAGELETRGETFGIKTHNIDGNDILGVYETARNAIDEIRKTNRPQIIFMQTYRLAAHSKGDDLRDKREIDFHWKNEPIIRARKMLEEKDCEKIEAEIRSKVANILDLVKQSS